jgi:hypothetical protein
MKYLSLYRSMTYENDRQNTLPNIVNYPIDKLRLFVTKSGQTCKKSILP